MTASKGLQKREKVVIIGGGFAGLKLLKELDKEKFEVILIDRHNYHSFPPLFYQVASSGLEPAGICFPLRAEMKRYLKSGARFVMGRVTEINSDARTISTREGDTISYDRLIIAAGTTNNFFGIDNLKDCVYTLKSTPEALRCRNDILDRLERAAGESDPEKRRRLLDFVVVGAGPTGVEIAGALGELKRYNIPREYPELSQDDISITIIEGAGRVLGTMSEKSSEQALRYLRELRVDVKTGIQLKSYDGSIITTASGETMHAGMLIWTAGVTTVPFSFVGSQPSYGRGHRIEVDSCNRVKGLERVYAVGDICIMTSDLSFPQGHPQLAQVAIQQARLLARNLNRHLSAPKDFTYNDKGSMATVGRNRAVVDLPHSHFGGFAAWLTWMFIHLISILGMRNKLTVLINWAWGYFTYGSSLRMLFRTATHPTFKNPNEETV